MTIGSGLSWVVVRLGHDADRKEDDGKTSRFTLLWCLGT